MKSCSYLDKVIGFFITGIMHALYFVDYFLKLVPKSM